MAKHLELQTGRSQSNLVKAMVRVSSGEVETMVQISGSILLMDVRRQVDGQADPLHIQ